MKLRHPALREVDLAVVLTALSDPTRLAIVCRLASDGAPEAMCSGFADHGSKSNLSYHLSKLREAGIINVRIEGTARYISLRRSELDARFPGLLKAVIAASVAPCDN